MKWSSSSNSSLSSSGAGMVLNSTNNNCNTSNSSSSHNGIGIRSNASDRRSIFYTDATDMDLQKNYNHKKVRHRVFTVFFFCSSATMYGLFRIENTMQMCTNVRCN